MNKIFVYSATGNSLASAKQIAVQFDAEIVHITDENVGEFGGEFGALVFPVYAYGVPKTVKRFIQKSKFKFQYFALLATKGSHQGGSLAEGIKLFRKRKQRVHYSNGILCVENFVHMFKLPPEEVLKTQIEQQRQKTAQVIEDLEKRKTNRRWRFRPESAFVSFVFKRFTKTFAKRYKITQQCNGCGICHKVCPAGAIQMVEMDNDSQEPHIIPKLCDHCQACLQLCPKKAIRFGKIQPNGRRYKHSDVTVAELLKR